MSEAPSARGWAGVTIYRSIRPTRTAPTGARRKECRDRRAAEAAVAEYIGNVPRSAEKEGGDDPMVS